MLCHWNLTLLFPSPDLYKVFDQCSNLTRIQREWTSLTVVVCDGELEYFHSGFDCCSLVLLLLSQFTYLFGEDVMRVLRAKKEVSVLVCNNRINALMLNKPSFTLQQQLQIVDVALVEVGFLKLVRDHK